MALHPEGGPAKLALARIRLRSSLWPFPIAASLAALAAAAGMLQLDVYLGPDAASLVLFGGQAPSAREVLSTIASSLLTFTGLVFSITILVLQLASSQFSPRVLRTFLEDRATKLSLAAFVGSFVYALAILPGVHEATEESPGFVPAASVSLAVLLVMLCVGVFIHYLHHMAHSIRAVHVIDRVATETRESIDRMYPESAALEPARPVPFPPGPPDRVLGNLHGAGVLASVAEERLLALACRCDCVLALVPYVGDFVPRGAPLFHVFGAPPPAEELQACLAIGDERTPDQDPAFGFRQLVDVAERALSPGINDPTTAVQALDQLHDILRALARRGFPSEERVDEAGRARLRLPRPSWEAFVGLAFDEIRQYGERSLQVQRRLRAALLDLRAVAPPSRRPPLDEQLELLDLAVRRSFATAEERRAAQTPSQQGHGDEPVPRHDA